MVRPCIVHYISLLGNGRRTGVLGVGARDGGRRRERERKLIHGDKSRSN